MNAPRIEYAGGATLAQVNESRRGCTQHAPLWWRQLAAQGASTRTNPVKPAPARAAKPAPLIGWMAGVCCPGVSRPAFGHRW
ncbi:MAG: hypothetical protein ACKOEM_13780 [Planctomycetia bacterium]